MSDPSPKRRSPFLLVDVSNTFTKYAWSTPSKLGRVQSHPTAKLSATWLKSVLRDNRSSLVILSSVVPSKTRLFQKILGRRLHSLHGEADLKMKVDYPLKHQIGADRLANAIAAQHYFGAPCIVLDFGTAVTFDVVNQHGAYCGGVIAPGLNVMTDYLFERTALLPKVKLVEPRTAIGKSTEQAILAGAMFGYRGLIREVLQAIQKELNLRGKIKVVATGGQADLVTRKMKEIQAVRPHLTLEGLRLWAKSLEQLKPIKRSR